MLVRMMLAGVPVHAEAVAELATTVRAVGADELADRLERALADSVALLGLTIDERAIILAALEDPPEGLAHNVQSVICVRTNDDGAECAAKFDATTERVIVVRCDQGSCVSTLKGDNSEGGGFELENG